MASQRLPLLQWLCGLLLLACAADALKFDLIAHPGAESQKKEKCIRNFVSRETLVVVTVTSDGVKGDGMVVNVHVSRPRSACRRLNACRRETGPELTWPELTWPELTCRSDPRCPGQRVRQAEGRGRRVPLRLHLARRRAL